VVRDVVPLIQPPPESSQTLLEAYKRFAAQTSAMASVAGACNPISAANALAAAGKYKEAIDLLKEMVMKTPQPLYPSDSAARSEEYAYGYYLKLLSSLRDLSATSVNTDLVPFGEGAAVPWLRRVADVFADWANDERFDPDRALSLLVVSAHRLHQAGGSAGTARALREVSRLLMQPRRFSRRTLNLALGVAGAAGYAFEPATLHALLEDGRLSFSRVAGVIGGIAQVEGPQRALELAERHAAYTQNDKLLATLVSLHERAGNVGRAEHWQAVRVAAAQAREQLGMREQVR
jgi:hypothetical protein